MDSLRIGSLHLIHPFDDLASIEFENKKWFSLFAIEKLILG